MKKTFIIISAVVLVAAAAGAFYGGMLYGKNSDVNSRFAVQGPGGANFNSEGGTLNRQMGGGANAGEIIAKDDKSITIKLLNGGSKIIFFSGSTEINKFVSGTTSDLEIGKNVIVQGDANPNGSVAAESIQIRPQTDILPKTEQLK